MAFKDMIGCAVNVLIRFFFPCRNQPVFSVVRKILYIYLKKYICAHLIV